MSDVRNEAFDADRLIHHMAGDKKAEGGNLTFILVKTIGEAYVAKKVDRNSIRDFLVTDGAVAQETV